MRKSELLLGILGDWYVSVSSSIISICATQWGGGDVDNEGGYACVRVGGVWEISVAVPFSQFCQVWI